jgi:leucyl aminopeptidase
VIPGGQALTAVAIAAKIGKAAKLAKIVLTASKLAKLAKVVKLGMKAYQLYKSPVVQAVMDKIKEGKQVTPQEESIVNQVAVANDIDPNTPNVLTPEEFKAVAPPNAVQAVAPIIASTDVEKKKGK